MNMTFMLEVNIPEKVERRACAVLDVGYLFTAKPFQGGLWLGCIRPLDGHELSSVICAYDELDWGAKEIINDAYNILYGEENDQEP